jgi:hypothetical protein
MSKILPLAMGCVFLLGAHASAQITGKTNVGSFGPPPPRLELKVSFTEPSGEGVLDAGETGLLKVSISNTGGSVAERVRVSLRAAPQLQGCTFPSELEAGNVEPGKLAEVVFQLSAEKSMVSQTVDLTVRATTVGGTTSEPETIKLVTRELAKVPVLVATAEFVEPSGNRLLDAGETGSIRVVIQNTGNAPAKNVLARLVRTDRLMDLTTTQSVSVGEIGVGATATAAFQVKASESVQGRTVKFTIEVSSSSTSLITYASVDVETKERVIVDVTPPEIILKRPAELLVRGMRVVPSEIKTTSSSLAIEGTARDTNGIAAVLINGAEAQLKRAEFSAEFSYSALLRLGENRIEITAVDSFKNESKLTLVVRREEELIAGQNQALLFAINSYDSWPRLTNPIPDARAIAEELRRFYGFSVELIEDATQDQILSTLRRYAAKRYGENDQLFIFFAGHGQFDEVLGDGYLVAKDSKFNDEIKTSYVSHSNLRTIVNNIPCKHIFLVVDACFGGTFDPLIAANLRGEDEYTEVTRTEFIQRKMRFRTRRFLTSGGKEYVPDGRPGQHSPFVRRLLEAFRSYGGKDGILTINEILQYVEKVKPEPRAGEFGTNEPGSDFIFVAR